MIKAVYYILSALTILITFSSFDTGNACKYVGSNIGYVKSQTEKAIENSDLNMVKYHAYKALNAIEKSKQQFEDCGCYTAEISIYKGLENLKNATKETSIDNAKILLKKALVNTLGSLDALDKFNSSNFPGDVLALNTKNIETYKKINEVETTKLLHLKIDKTLVNFKNSLDDTINTVDCKKAYEYASTVYKDCEQKLLNNNLTEAKKYYNISVKNIVAEALVKLDNCSKK